MFQSLLAFSSRYLSVENKKVEKDFLLNVSCSPQKMYGVWEKIVCLVYGQDIVNSSKNYRNN